MPRKARKLEAEQAAEDAAKQAAAEEEAKKAKKAKKARKVRKARVVNRKYYSKKLGTFITKQYTYNKRGARKGTKKRYLINSTGKLNRTAIKILQETYGDDYSDVERAIKLNQLQGKKSLRLDRFIATFEHDMISGMFANAGISIEEAAEELGIKAEEFYNKSQWKGSVKSQWKGSVFTASNGTQYKFEFSYDGDIFRKI